jgi:2-keto-4-pentenoate hydratase/2-oxohepta-3-ene-1,7-dioic acid hydratase in catechol pathway
MKLATIIQGGRRAPAILAHGRAIRLPGRTGAPGSLEEVVADLDRWRPWLDAQHVSPGEGVPLDEVTLGPPLRRPAKVVAVGLNYADHAAEGSVALPAEPLLFAKFPSSIIGPDEAITWDPALTGAVDYEAELAVVIGRRAAKVDVASALDHVFAYTCLNDISARDIQFADVQWVRGKSLDTFCPVGPWLVTADEIPDPQALAIECEVSGEILQSASTADMIFGVAELISRISHTSTLEPGDLIATGTPPGVGYFREPRRLLRDGDEVIVRIEGLGELRNPVRVG